MSHVQIVLALSVILIVVIFWKSGKASKFWRATIA
jgi:hypothetical protein